jgi:uncharacterized repeat protein (TIGR02543 family)
VFFQSAVQSDDSANERLYTYSPVTNRFTALGAARTKLGTQVLGYNTADNYVYGLFNYQTSNDDTRMNLVKFDNLGAYTVVNSWSLPNQFNVGDFWNASPGHYFVVGGDYLDTWRLIDVTNTTSSATQPSTDFTITGSGSGPKFKGKDMTIQGNTGYGLHDDTLYVLDLNTRVVRTKAVTFSGGRGASDGFGSAYADALGNLYFFENSTSQVWRLRAEDIGLASPTLYRVGSAPAYVSGAGSVKLQAPNDGASCPNARSPYSATITSENAVTVTDDTATVTATVNPNSISTTAKVCYGTSATTSGGRLAGCTETAQAANASTGTPLTGSSAVPLTPINLSGLSPRTTYYWQVVTASDWATTYGSVANFTTTAIPETTTSAATAVSATGATLNGIVNPGGRSTTVGFCYGTHINLTGCTSVSAAQSPLASSSDDTAVSVTLGSLTPGTTYYARVSATNADGSASGSIVSFTTSAIPLVSLGNTSDVTPTDARVTGQVNPKALATTVSFCVGTAPDLTGCSPTPATQSPLLAIDDSLSVSADLTGLNPATQYYVRVSATNTNGTATSTIGSFTTAPTPLSLSTTTGALPPATVGSAYAKTLTAGGGTAPYTWTVASGTLPAGLTLNSSSGVISGTPTVDGSTSFVVRVTDASSATATRTFSISTGATPTATTTAVSSVAGTTATLNGIVDPGNLLSAVDFCYGTSINLTGCTTIPASQSPLTASTSTSSVSAGLTGLAMGTTYYARVTATNGAGSSNGSIVTFTTTNVPSVTTGSATFLRNSGTEATLSGTVNPNGASTSVSFCYGTTPTLSGCTTTSAGTLTASRTPSPVSVNISGLTPNAVYYFTVLATNSLGTTAGSTATFTMPSASAVGPTVTNVSPATGPVSGGTSVTITGSNFSATGAGATVLFDDSPATVTARAATSITVTAPAASHPGAVDVIVANPDGQAARAVNAFTYTSAVRYTLTYNGNGSTSGVVPTDATAYPYDDTVTVAAAGTMSRSGYDFAGWNTAANGTGTSYAAGASFRILSNTTLYAQWTPIAIDSLSDDTVNFGQQAVSAGATEPQVVSVINSGAAPMNISGITVNGTNASDFVVVPGGTCDGGSTVTGNSSCTIELAFAPSQVGARSASLQVTTTAGTLTGSLAGTGTTAYSVTYFGNGATSGSPPTDATAYAPGSSVTVLGRASLVRAGYEFAGWNTAAGGGGTPRAAGSTFVINGDDSLFAQWTAVGVPDLSPGTLSFGSRQVSSGPSAAQTATLSNSGAASLSVTSVTVHGADASDFALSGGTCTSGGTVASASSCTVRVTFDPTQTGSRSASVHVVTSAGTVTAALTGSGTSPTPTPTPNTPPGAPRAVAGRGGDTAVIVTWEPPTREGSYPITDYQVVATPGGAGCQAKAPGLQCIVSGLQNGVAYTFRVRALNGAGWGEYSTPSAPVTPEATPTPSILIVGGRDAATPRRVWVTGSAAALIGETVVPHFRFRGQVGYRTGVRTVSVDSEGTFTWQRRTGKQITVYFTSDLVRSNRVTIPSRSMRR